MTQEEAKRSAEFGAPGSEIRLTHAALDIQVVALERFELESLVKRYFNTLHAIAEIECREGNKWCYEDPNIECEHNAARKVLDL